jgi:hypothetical protein
MVSTSATPAKVQKRGEKTARNKKEMKRNKRKLENMLENQA